MSRDFIYFLFSMSALLRRQTCRSTGLSSVLEEAIAKMDTEAVIQVLVA